MTAALLMALSSIASMRLLRIAITAISEAAKKPFAKIKAMINTASSQKSSIVIRFRLLGFTGHKTGKYRARLRESRKSEERDSQ